MSIYTKKMHALDSYYDYDYIIWNINDNDTIIESHVAVRMLAQVFDRGYEG